MNTKKANYIICLISSILIFSTFEVVCKKVGGYISPTQLTCYRFFIGGLILLPFSIRELKIRDMHLKSKDYLLFLFFGFLLVSCSMTLSQLGIQYSNASISAVLFSSNPLFISLFSVPFLNEKMTVPKFVGLIIGILGLITTCLHLFTDTSISDHFILGVVLIIISMLIFSFYTVINKKLSKNYSSIITLSFSSIFGALTMIPLLFIQSNGTNPLIFSFSEIVPEFLYLSILGTGLAYFFYFDALAHLNTSAGSMCFFVKPAIASILSFIVLSEKITPNIIVGIILILIGLYVSIFVKPHCKAVQQTKSHS